jgi:hypothetical protein
MLSSKTDRRTLTKEEWRHINDLVGYRPEPLKLIETHHALPLPIIIGEKLICTPEYGHRLRLTLSLVEGHFGLGAQVKMPSEISAP